MTTKLKAVLASAATLFVAGGITFGVALQQAGQAHDVTCSQFNRAMVKPQQRDNQRTAYIAFLNDFDLASIPPAFDDSGTARHLGDCAGGWCEYNPNGCTYEEHAPRFPYNCPPKVDGNRVCAMSGPLLWLGNWKRYAAVTPDVVFLDGCGDLLTRCLANFTGAQCRDMLEPIVQLKIEGGTNQCCGHDCSQSWCRHGLIYGPGMGGSCDESTPAQCPYAAIIAGQVQVTGCSAYTSYKGKSEPERQAVETFSDAELEL
jgi:hypothetical protein